MLTRTHAAATSDQHKPLEPQKQDVDSSWNGECDLSRILRLNSGTHTCNILEIVDMVDKDPRGLTREDQIYRRLGNIEAANGGEANSVSLADHSVQSSLMDKCQDFYVCLRRALLPASRAAQYPGKDPETLSELRGDMNLNTLAGIMSWHSVGADSRAISASGETRQYSYDVM